MPLWPVLLGALVGALAAPAFSQTAREISSGTGFFVSNRGYIITNHHVVSGCASAKIRGAVAETQASVVASDEQYDLALLHTDAFPGRIATLRNTTSNIGPGEAVMIMGYPLEHAVTGIYEIAPSSIVSANGPQGEIHWLQFKSVAQKGNSGGPLLDRSGNVVGVVTGKARLLRYNKMAAREELVRESDIAVSLDILKTFLQGHGVYFRQNASQTFLSLPRIADQARDYIVNIHCRPQVAGR